MNNLSQERLYQLLPAIHRIRDAEQGEVLHALLGVIEEELQRLEADIGGLYNNWFIETCDEWVVPYIGDLLNVRGLFSVQGAPFSQRALVANTVAFRRRKSTAAVLERLAWAVTGWSAVAVEFFELLAATQYLNHVRSGKGGTVDLRAMDQLELLNGPFEQSAHLAEIRHIDNGRGKYNIPQVGLFLWRLEAYFIEQVTPRPVTTAADGRYYFSPLGHDMPLFNQPQTVTVISQRTAEENVPGRLRRRPLYEELEARRQALVDDGKTPSSRYFGSEQPVLKVFTPDPDQSGKFKPLKPEEILIRDLSDWCRPEPTKSYKRSSDGQWQAGCDLRLMVASDGNAEDEIIRQFQMEFDSKKKECAVLLVRVTSDSDKWTLAGFDDAGEFRKIVIDDPNDELSKELKEEPRNERRIVELATSKLGFPIKVAVDPVLGRLAFATDFTPDPVAVSYAYGFAADLGGGTYDRHETLASNVDAKIWFVGKYDKKADFRTLAEALAYWATWAVDDDKDTVAVITLLDNTTYTESLKIELAKESAKDHELVIQADNDKRPTLLGNLPITGGTGKKITTLKLNGLLIEGSVNIAPASLEQLQIIHCTLVPGGSLELDENGNRRYTDHPSVIVEETTKSLLEETEPPPEETKLKPLSRLVIDHSIVGPLYLPVDMDHLDVMDSIIDALERDRSAITGADGQQPGPPTTLQRTTVFGKVHVQELELASETIFTAPVAVVHRQVGCVRFSYLPAGSIAPRRYRCQPDLALEAEKKRNPALTPTEKENLALRLTPSFTSLRYGQPGYAQLSLHCAVEIRTGSENEDEMGAFNLLRQAQRTKNLLTNLDEYLRFGLEAGIFFVT